MFARQTKDSGQHGPGPNGQGGPPRLAPARSFEAARSGFVAGAVRSPMFDEVCRELVPMVEQVIIPFVSKEVKDGVFPGGELFDKSAKTMLDELLRWTHAMRGLR